MCIVTKNGETYTSTKELTKLCLITDFSFNIGLFNLIISPRIRFSFLNKFLSTILCHKILQNKRKKNYQQFQHHL